MVKKNSVCFGKISFPRPGGNHKMRFHFGPFNRLSGLPGIKDFIDGGLGKTVIVFCGSASHHDSR
jgi:hypothetical protein